MAQQVIKEIVTQKEISPNHFKMVIRAPKIAKEAQPGQFLHLKWVNDLTGQDPLLRRPISLNSIDQAKGTITIIYRVIGRGTKLLSSLQAGDEIDLMGPLGESFSVSDSASKIAIVGGGMGIAPLLPLVNQLLDLDKQVTLLLGANTKEQLINLAEYQKLDVNLKIATRDGSCGQQGFITDLLTELSKIDYVYTCGPEIMMEKVQDWAKQEKIVGEASLEERMGCGTGACLSCVCKIKVGSKDDWQYQKTCTQGPIFPLGEVIFGE
ncbi:2-polyprenylphenol hydroxylase-like oxidoreductase [Halobacteroides halobius DSM 5150]|uniref:Dihydroorotate dehydrogenase B (NAD(+)), electron transfer subunit n=1 Tax=Halobacteroides halobius (strain ATCC 35273 / DSM 5150 / MD-1) TaxID=748449 RepID=L0K955_HALHC|nr:dihydroorotate dehydrogenase electron transfer subunit [Halobacteroides halobius]AGB40879.1 2-polyprenylphenol hydroxylase-like oxidoreductase [Halobacteroides halobius DSM 5150]